MKPAQHAVIGNLIRRKSGATSPELADATYSLCVHRRLTDLKEKGWKIHKEPVKGRNYSRYFGIPPQGAKSH